MQKKVISIIAGIVIAVIVAGIASFYSIQKPDDGNKSTWIVSGPFAISKPQYKLGESVFVTVNNLLPSESGNITIITPQKKIWTSIPFNSTMKDHFNYYFKPDISKAAKISTTEELVGPWIVVFEGVNYQPLMFEITNETLSGFIPGEETQIERLMNRTEIERIMNSYNSTG